LVLLINSRDQSGMGRFQGQKNDPRLRL
jgi:hypothetical protein